MEDYLIAQGGQVDPEVRAHVFSLVNAVGGTGTDDEGRYVLGDEALACLKDLKKWLRLYDEKTNRMDVARCLAEANLVKGDLLEILAAWPEDATENRFQSKIALACLELLVPLTWPFEKNETTTTMNHHRHIPYLQLAQIGYKREILEHVSTSILRTTLRVGLPSIALPIGERTQRDEGIIKLLLYFLRNIVMISAPENLPVEWNENEVSRSATIEAFEQQDVFALLLTMASNMGEDFNTQDVVLLEVLFHLLKGVNVEKVFMNEEELNVKNSNDLKNLMSKEAAMLRGYSKNAPTRHNRFGTMIWVKRDDERMSTVSGQDMLKNGQRTLAKMDESKKWRRPKQRSKEERTTNSFDYDVPLTRSANQKLRSFVEEFLDSGFNPLFSHIRRAIERETERVLDGHPSQYFYVISWFLEAERARRKSQKELANRKNMAQSADNDATSFGLVASVLNQETFVLLNRFMQDRLDLKIWREVNAGMRCFTQILLMVQDMADSKLDEDKEIAENIQNRIFYEESTHDRIIATLRGYKDQGFSYLDGCTELAHVFLRMLERYSKENLDLQVRSRRRTQKKKKTATQQPAENQDDAADQDSEAEELAEASRVSKERKFDFNRFAAKFMTQSCINTFVTFTGFFKDLTNEQLKRAHRFFYRVAFKQESSVVLFRIDIISLFNRMIKGPEALNSASPMFREWEEFVRQLFRRLVKKFQARPELAVELLFSKINSTVYYLEYGYEKQTLTRPRPPAELEIKGALTRQEQIGVVVAVLHEDKMDAINWVKGVLDSAANERQAWEAANAARTLENEGNLDNSEAEMPKAQSIVVRPDSEERRVSMFKDNKLRLLMTLSGFVRLGEPDDLKASWIVPGELTAEALRETAAMIEKHRWNPITQYGDEDPVPAEELLKRKLAPRPGRRELDEDSEGDIDFDEEFLFPAGGPTARKSTADDGDKKKRRRRRKSDADEDEEGLNDEELARRRRKRLLADLEKRRKIKSTEFVHDSDDETDEERDKEFFAREAERKNIRDKKILEALDAEKSQVKSKKRKSNADGEGYRKRRKHSGSDTDSNSASDSDDIMTMDDDNDLQGVSASASPRLPENLGTSEDEASDTPLSSQTGSHKLPPEAETEPALESEASSVAVREKVSELALRDGSDALGGAEADDDEDVPISTARRRGRVAVLDDSDEE